MEARRAVARGGKLPVGSAKRADHDNLKQCYSHIEPQRVLGIVRDALNTLISRGYLPAAKKLGTAKIALWLIPYRSIEAFIARDDFPGRVVLMDRTLS